MFSHILVALDGSPLAECVIPHTLAIAQVFRSRVTLLQVLKRPSTGTHELPVDPLDWQI
jgi:nucleotide-binding universal stress UspA family protein